MKRDPFVNRYTIKLGCSVLVALCNFVIQFLLPRVFSVEEYGFYTYNLNVFTSVIVMANMSTSSALVAKYSKKCEDIGYVRFYLMFYGIMTLVLTVGLLFLYSFEGIRGSFGGQTILAVLLGLEASVFNKLTADVVSLYDAAAISRFPAVMQILQRFLLCLFVVGIYLLGYLTLILFYIGQIIIFAIAIVILLKEFFKDYKLLYDKPVTRAMNIYAREYCDFCRPLVVAGVISQGIVILMNYTLLKHAGAAEQAMFGAAWQLNTVVGYIFSPYAELMKREFAVITDASSILTKKFWQSIKVIIWLSSYFAIFIAVFAQWLLPLLYGDKYVNAVVVTQMIMVYTIFQAWGQLCGSFMIAMEETKGYAVLSIVGQIATVLCVFIFQVPNFLFHDGLGSTGIGLTYMCANYISVIVMMHYIIKKRGGSYFRMHGICSCAVVSCFTAAILIQVVMKSFFSCKEMMIQLVGIGISGLIYTVIIFGELYAFPNLAGLSRETIHNFIDKVKVKWIKK